MRTLEWFGTKTDTLSPEDCGYDVTKDDIVTAINQLAIYNG